MNPTIGEMLAKTARTFPDKTAIICDDKTLTYREFDSRVNQRSHAFLKSGISNKSRVAVLLSNSIELVEIFFALARVGCVTVPLNYRLAGRELSFILENVNPATLIVGEEFSPLINEFESKLKKIDFFEIIIFEKLFFRNQIFRKPIFSKSDFSKTVFRMHFFDRKIGKSVENGVGGRGEAR